MKARNSLDVMGQNILKILSFYELLGIIELWYEVGEDDAVKERVTKEELSSRLESLPAGGFVEQVKNAQGGTNWALKRGEAHR